MKIAVIGFGTFGQFIAKRFVEQGHTVFATNRSDKTEEAKAIGVEFYATADELASEDFDCAVLATSIISLEEVVKKLPLEKFAGKLLVDVLSVKAFPKEFLKRILPNDIDILCTHPMFGPDSGARSWKGLAFVYEKVRIRNEDICNDFLGIFEKEGCEMVALSAEKHDEFAASSQFITHTQGRILSKLKLHKTPIDTKGYEQLLTLVDHTVHDSFDLYYALYRYNPSAKQELQKIEQSLRDLKNQLFDKKREERKQIVIGIQGGDGSFCHQAAIELVEKYRLENPSFEFLITSESVLDNLNHGEIDFGVFAIENSGSGTVLPSIFSMSKYPHEIIELHEMKLTQCLLKRPGQDIAKATQIVTHPQAIKQCQNTLKEKYPHLRSDYLSDDYDTAECAKKLSQGEFEEGTVVIASKIAAEKYGLEIEFEPLNDDPENYTSFVYCKRREI